MDRRKITIWAAILAAAAICLGLLLYRNYQSQFVWLEGTQYSADTRVLDLSGQQLSDWETLKQFSQLEQLDLRGTQLTVEDYHRIKSWFPGCAIAWDIPFQGSRYPADTTQLTVTNLTEEELPLLELFPQLRTVYATGCGDYPVLHTLRTQRPDLEVIYHLPLNGKVYSYQATALTLADADPKELADMLPYFSRLETVTFTGALPAMDEITALREQFPQTQFTWKLTLQGIALEESTQELDLTGVPLTVEEFEAVLPYLPNLTYVDMTDCGISNEDMDALRSRHEAIKIVWTVNLGSWYRLRTDATWFMPIKHGYLPRGNDLYNLRYCHDIIAIDIGHRSVDNIDFVAFMPHLKYLLIGDSTITDLTPLTGLTELIYLEMFLTTPQDLSPLATLTALEDLNMHYVWGDAEVIAQMTWLKNLWWKGCGWYQQQMLREAIPDCHFNFTSFSSTGEGWRQLPNYYAQRDIFGMHYMTG